MGYDVYMHGQILGTHSFLLKGEFLQPDEYSELGAKYFLPGGETGTAATVLASLGVSVKIDGTHIGTEVAPLLKEFYKDKPVDLSSLFLDPDYEGLMDYVVIAGLVRSPMGVFQSLYEPQAKRRWNMPKEEDIVGNVTFILCKGEDSLDQQTLTGISGMQTVDLSCPEDQLMGELSVYAVDLSWLRELFINSLSEK